MEPNLQNAPIQPTVTPVQSFESKKSLSKWPLIIIGIVLIVILMAGVYFLGQKSKLKTQTTTARVISAPTRTPNSQIASIKIVKVGEITTERRGYNSLPVVVSGNYAYISDSNKSDSDSGNLDIINVTNPKNPLKVGSVRTKSAIEATLSVSGNYAYVVGSPTNYFVPGTKNTLGEIEIIDISSPTKPTIVADTQDNLSGGPQGTVSGNYLYVANGSFGFRIFNISDPKKPVMVGSSKDKLSNATSIAITGNYAFVGNGISCAKGCSSLQVFDITNPANPINVGSINGLHSAGPISVSGNYAYILDDDSVDIIDIANPSNLKIISSVGSFSTGLNNPHSIAISGNYAYVTSYANGSIIVYNISDPLHPTLATTITEGLGDLSYPESITISGHFVYVTCLVSGKLVIYQIK
jgi:hypothetical protein